MTICDQIELLKDGVIPMVAAVAVQWTLISLVMATA